MCVYRCIPKSIQPASRESEVEDRHIEKVAHPFALIQVVDVVVVSRRRGEAQQGSEDWPKRKQRVRKGVAAGLPECMRLLWEYARATVQLYEDLFTLQRWTPR